MTEIRNILSAAVTAASILAVQPLAAQTSLIAPAPEKGLAVEAAHPHFKEMDLTLPTSIWYLSGRMPVGRQFRVVADVPFAHAAFDNHVLFGDRSNSVIGNPYIGMEYYAIPGLTVEAGVRAPLTSADESSFADVIGFLGEPHRGEAFLEDAVPVSGALMYEMPMQNGFTLRGRAGFTAAFYTGDDDDQETSTFADYGVFGNYALGVTRLGAGLSGRWFASADEGNFSDNSLHQLGFTIDTAVRGVRPGLSIRIPLDETHREVVDYSIGAYLQVPLR